MLAEALSNREWVLLPPKDIFNRGDTPLRLREHRFLLSETEKHQEPQLGPNLAEAPRNKGVRMFMELKEFMEQTTNKSQEDMKVEMRKLQAEIIGLKTW